LNKAVYQIGYRVSADISDPLSVIGVSAKFHISASLNPLSP